MTEQDVVDWALSLSGPEWRRIACRVVWCLKQDRPLPPPLSKASELVTDCEVWGRIRRGIAKERRRRNQYSRRAIKRERENRRRDYMRTYMRGYRSKS